MKKRNKGFIIAIECTVMILLGFALVDGTKLVTKSQMGKVVTEYDVDTSSANPSAEVEGITDAEEQESSATESQEAEATEENGADTDAEMEAETPLDLEDYSDAPQDNGCPYYVKVNRLQNVVTVYELDDEGYYTVPVKAMVCSVGADNGTPTGTYTTSDKHEWSALVGGVYGQYAYRINGQILFHSVPYYSKNKDDLESEEYNKLGTAASLGCIRLSVSDAKWIYDNCPSGTIVTIYDSEYPGPLGKPVAEILDLDDERSVWDPTDPDKSNPWNDGSIRILGGGNRTIERGYAYDLSAGVVVLDGSGRNLTEYLSLEDNVDRMKNGMYQVTYTVKTPDGRTAQLQSTIRVTDSIPPEITTVSETITLNRVQMVASNRTKALLEQISVLDAGSELDEDHITIDTSNIQEGMTEAAITVTAKDNSGNKSTVEYTVYIDESDPVIGEPETRQVTGDTDEEIERAILSVIPIEDEGSGIDSVKVSWTKHISDSTYSVMVIAKDAYGNVTTRFFDDFQIHE